MLLTVVPVFMAGVTVAKVLGGGIDRSTRLLALYAGCSFVVASLALPKEASGFYYYAECIAPLSMVCALTMNEWHSRGMRRWTWLAGTLGVVSVLGTIQVQFPVNECAAMTRMLQRKDKQLVTALSGDERILYACSDFMVRTGRPVYAADVFSMKQYIETHPEGAERLGQQMAAGFYEAIVLEDRVEKIPPRRWSSKVLEMIRRQYRLRGRVGSLYIYEPAARRP
jgi:hypothetical protein